MNTPPSPPPPSDPELPSLTPAVVDDDEALAEVVDAFIAAELVARERLAEIARLQMCLRDIVEADTWAVVVRIDEAIVERWSDLALEVARWAFVEGVRSGGQPR